MQEPNLHIEGIAKSENSEAHAELRLRMGSSFPGSLITSIVVWTVAAVVLFVIFAVPERFGLAGIAISPVYHGAMFLGMSIIAAVVVAFALFGQTMASRAFSRAEKEHARTAEALRHGDAEWKAFELEAKEFKSGTSGTANS